MFLPSSSTFFRLGFPLHALTKAIRLTRELQDVRFVREPVQQGGGQAFITEDLGPVGKTQVGGHQHGHPLIESGAELEDQLRSGG